MPQDIYHFANVQSFVEAQTTFDLAHPSALLYAKSGDGYKFAGVMYSAPADASEGQLNARIPLSVAPWHLHVNFCLPAGDAGQTLFDANSLFGLPDWYDYDASAVHEGRRHFLCIDVWLDGTYTAVRECGNRLKPLIV